MTCRKNEIHWWLLTLGITAGLTVLAGFALWAKARYRRVSLGLFTGAFLSVGGDGAWAFFDALRAGS